MSAIFQVASQAMTLALGDAQDTEIFLISSPGTSSARVFIFQQLTTSRLFAVKCAKQSRVQLLDEVSKHGTLVPYFGRHLPEVLLCTNIGEWQVMVSECDGIHTLHHLIMQSEAPHDQLLRLWEDVLDSLQNVWLSSSHPYVPALSPRYFPSRINRIRGALRNLSVGSILLDDCWDMPISVNGADCLSLAKCLESICEVGLPEIGVLCHGDPQPSNIIVGNSGQWYFVDWEWSGRHHDWRMMLAHLYGWWSSRCSLLPTSPSISISDGKLTLDYNLEIPEHIEEYQQSVVQLAIRMSKGEISKVTVSDINKYLAILYFGELRFLGLWNRHSFAIPMLAQAVSIASGTHKFGLGNRYWFPHQVIG